MARASLLVLLVPLLASAAGAGEQAAPPAPAVPVVTSTGLPEGIAPLPPELARRAAELVEATVELRGLPLRRPLVAGVLDVDGAERQIAAMIDQEVPPEELAAAERALRRFGLLPPAEPAPDGDGALRGMLLGLLVEQVAGYYDPALDYLALVTGVVDQLAGALPEAAAEQMLAALWVHEIVHALQGQHYDLEALTSEPFVSDRGLAHSALLEGDASLLMTSYLVGADLSTRPELADAVAAMADSGDQLAAGGTGVPGADALANAPAYLRESLLFPYLRGMAFVLELHRAGGDELVARAFAHDPPASTEQILHPEKWIEGSDPPIVFPLESLAPPAPGWERALVGSLGELGVRIALAERLPATERTETEAAAAGWGGDAFVLYGRSEGAGASGAGGSGELLGWITEWDTAEDADEFLRLASRAFGDWTFRRPTERRIVLVSGEPAVAPLAALVRALSEVEAGAEVGGEGGG